MYEVIEIDGSYRLRADDRNPISGEPLRKRHFWKPTYTLKYNIKVGDRKYDIVDLFDLT
jgi:hypothetical protein